MDYGQAPYGYSSQHVGRVSSGGASVGLRGSPLQGTMIGSQPGVYQPQPVHSQQSQPQYAGGGPPSTVGIARVDRSAQINDYVAKQKAAKLNAPLIKKENQRLAEARVMSASRSTNSGSSHSQHHPGNDDYLDDHSHLAPPQQQQQQDDYGARSNGANRGSGTRPISGQQPQQQSRQPAPTGGANQARSSSGGQRQVSYEENGGNGGNGGGGSSNAELTKRVQMLEDQIRLLKQQNRIFLAFMQNTEQQLAETRASLPPPTQSAVPSATPSRSRASAGGAAPSSGQEGYPNNMSQGTKQVLQRSQSERHTQPPPAAAAPSRQPQPQSNSPSMNGVGPLGGSDFDQTFAPLDDDRERKERLKSAKKKAGLLNLREKMAQKEGKVGPGGQGAPGGPAYSAQDYEDPPSQQGNGNGYGYAGGIGGGGGGYSSQPQQQQSSAPTARYPSQQQSSQQPPQNLPRTAATSRQPPPAAAQQPQSRSIYQQQQQSSHDDDDQGYGDDHGDPNDSFGGNGGMQGGIPPGADEEVETFPCPNCGRRMNENALAKHVAKQLCKQKPRKVFNMAQKRLEDLAAEAREAGIKLPAKPIIPATAAGGASAAASSTRRTNSDALPVKKQSKWRADHEKFMAAIQQGKMLQQAMASGIPLSSIPHTMTKEEDDDRTPCPHCGRKFSSNVADRHIPHCKNTKNKPKATAASAARLGSTARGPPPTMRR